MNAPVSSASRLMIHKSIQSIRAVRKSLESAATVGFVPTMGALHGGHLSLIRKAREANDVVFSSIFVNPTQFGVGEDLDKYPRQLERDCQLLENLGVDHLFAPDSNQIMYGPNHVTNLDPRGFDDIPEGISRPGHFAGVATIVTKLFNIVQPTRAYFGQKDAAQCVLIQRIVQDLNMDVDVVICDTIREDDGLAMSSRNAYLLEKERAAAPVVYKSLCAARDLFASRRGTNEQLMSSKELKDAVTAILESEPLISEIQYVTVDSRATMQPIEQVGSEGAVISLACKLGNVRLIDNIMLS